MGPQKIGALIQQGYAACVNDGNLFLKRFPFVPGAVYPDFNSNFEAFTRQDMLEIETLGPMVTVACGAYADHQETWYLLPDAVVPEGDAECATWLSDIAETHPL